MFNEKEYMKQYYLKNKIRLDRYRKEWSGENKEKELEYKRKWVSKNNDYYRRIEKNLNPIIKKARWCVGNAIRYGKLKRGTCYCGSQETQAHHYNYTKPLEVIWLCPKHHKKEHKLIEAKQVQD